MHSYLQRIHERLTAVNISIETIRNAEQTEALSQVTELIQQVIEAGNTPVSFKRCQMYWNACSCSDGAECLDPLSSSTASNGHGPANGLIDKKFESLLLGCTLDDQKMIKKRVKSLYMQYMTKPESMEGCSKTFNGFN